MLCILGSACQELRLVFDVSWWSKVRSPQCGMFSSSPATCMLILDLCLANTFFARSQEKMSSVRVRTPKKPNSTALNRSQRFSPGFIDSGRTGPWFSSWFLCCPLWTGLNRTTAALQPISKITHYLILLISYLSFLFLLEKNGSTYLS
jgi:hypothetical protein